MMAVSVDGRMTQGFSPGRTAVGAGAGAKANGHNETINVIIMIDDVIHLARSPHSRASLAEPIETGSAPLPTANYHLQPN